MPKQTVNELSATIEQLQTQMAELARRLEGYEETKASAPVPPVNIDPVNIDKDVPAGITEEELIAISAAIGAYLGVRAHIRQIRLVSTTAWAQQGRVSIQASHQLQG